MKLGITIPLQKHLNIRNLEYGTEQKLPVTVQPWSCAAWMLPGGGILQRCLWKA